MSLELQKRDIELLKYVFASRVASYSQLRNRFFPGKYKTAAYNRISSLCREGFLRPNSYFEGIKSHRFVESTEKSWTSIRSLWPFEIDRPHYRSESPQHDIRLAEIVSKFERLKVFHSFMSENLLQSSLALAAEPSLKDIAGLQADGALLLNSPEGRIYVYGIEFEISKKTPERYQDKLASYYHANRIDGVIYICADQQIVNALARIDREICKERDSILFCGLESDVLQSHGKIFFENTKKDGIEFY